MDVGYQWDIPDRLSVCGFGIILTPISAGATGGDERNYVPSVDLKVLHAKIGQLTALDHAIHRLVQPIQMAFDSGGKNT